MIDQVLPRSGRGVRYNAFTLIELIVVVGIIIVLAGLVLSTVGYARKKSARARAETEIAAMSAACENYKADNGVYPRGPASAITIGTVTIPANATDNLDARTRGNPAETTDPTYGATSLYLYTLLSGDLVGHQQATGKTYFAFKPQMLAIDSNAFVTAIKDPFGNSYGYSTAQAYYIDNPAVNPNYGFNPTFDLWSTAGTSNPTAAAYEQAWIKNW